ncbi:recombinase family protein [Kribbella sp. CA-293567]|uniref:recombinase family protein n=1 Tax=Kribbella sp. CA-293567 TaxID=3002436 RepID=UPI0022DDD2EC|nr:recombinase family protein [Kribbella sp. CA-293567]WBQ05748.1 recombinase family protein [Kribbella sp. CA-293567]
MAVNSQYADLYLRVSIDKAGKTTIERQEADCRAWVKGSGLKVRRSHVDRGRSAYLPGVDREGFRSALAAVSSGVVGTLVVWKLDRLSRQGMDEVGLVLDKIGATGGRLVSVQDNLDTSNAGDRKVVGLLAELARSESENLGLRIRSAKTFLRTQGRWIGGAPPYGLVNRDGRLFVDPRTGAVVREIARRLLAGESLLEVAKWLNAADVAAPRGGLWGIGTISQLMRGPTTIGLAPETIKNDDGRYSSRVRPWRDPETGRMVSIMGPGQEPLISPADQALILAVFDERAASSSYGRSRGRQSTESSYLLTGLLRCASCGERMSRSGNSYRCQTVRLGRACVAPGGAYIWALDDAVQEAWRHRLTTAAENDPLLAVVADRMASRQDPEGIAKRRSVLAALTDERSALSALDEEYYLQRTIGRDRYLSLKKALLDRLDGLQQSLEKISVPQFELKSFLEPMSLRARWSAASVGERRGLLQLAIEEVRVSQGVRGRRFDPRSRLLVVWATDRRPDS